MAQDDGSHDFIGVSVRWLFHHDFENNPAGGRCEAVCHSVAKYMPVAPRITRPIASEASMRYRVCTRVMVSAAADWQPVLH